MTPARLHECLAIIRWPTETLAAVLQVAPALPESWLLGREPIPMLVGSWLEALCFTHEASDLMRPALNEEEQPAAAPVRASREHVPVYSYNLLRTLGRGPVELRALFGTDDEGAVFFLVSRGLAERDGEHLVITDEGRAIGQVALALPGSGRD